MATIKDVAKHANVSTTVVSKALNGYADVSEETRKKVLKAVEELNYSPNMLAKNLKQKVTKSIALIFSNFEYSNGKDGVLFKMMTGIFEAASHYNYEVLLYTRSLSEQQDKSYWQFCKEHKVSGAVITKLENDGPLFPRNRGQQLPVRRHRRGFNGFEHGIHHDGQRRCGEMRRSIFD